MILLYIYVNYSDEPNADLDVPELVESSDSSDEVSLTLYTFYADQEIPNLVVTCDSLFL